VQQLAFERTTRRFTVDEVLAMVEAGILHEDEPLELIEGELIMVPPQGPPHAGTATRLRDRLIAAYGTGHVVREDKPMIAGADSLPEPDIGVFHGTHDEFTRRHPRGDEAVLVMELARTSLVLDRYKAGPYARAGVPVYWLLDMKARRLEVHTEPHADGRYAVVHVLAEQDEVALPGLAIGWQVSSLLPPE
jgi:Uma2 family endonuclease